MSLDELATRQLVGFRSDENIDSYINMLKDKLQQHGEILSLVIRVLSK